MNPTPEDSFTQTDEAVVVSKQEQSKLSTTTFQYQVKHGFFKWSIEKFSLFPDVNDKYCLSPIFKLGETWWYLVLHPKAKICRQNKISFNLLRHKSDPGPESVKVSYRMGLESGENKLWFKPKESVVFKKGDSYGFQTSTLGHLEDFVIGKIENNDTLSVLCEMYAVYKLTVAISSLNYQRLNIDTDLPLDLLNLFQTEQRYDVLIEIPKFRVRAHKCILSARSKTLSRLFQDDKSFIQLSCTRSCLYCVLYYMYTGSFLFLAKNAVFSIGLYELACELSLLDLRDLLTPCKIELKSRIVVNEYGFICELHDFEVTDISTGKMESPIYCVAAGINVKFSVQQQASFDYMIFWVNVSGIGTTFHFDFQLYILKSYCEPFELIPAMFLPNSDSLFESLNFRCPVCFLVGDILQYSESDGNLLLYFTCKRYTFVHLSDSSTDNSKDFLDLRSDYNMWCINLCEDLTKLFTNGYLSDSTLVASDDFTEFKVHSHILAARCAFFKNLFNSFMKKNTVIDVSNIDSDSLELVLLYIYSGEIKYKSDTTIYDILNLYKSSEWLQINSLKRKCSKYLARNLDNFCIFDVSETAEKFKNSYLISACNGYVVRNQLLEMLMISSSSSQSSSSTDVEEEESDLSSPDESNEGCSLSHYTDEVHERVTEKGCSFDEPSLPTSMGKVHRGDLEKQCLSEETEEGSPMPSSLKEYRKEYSSEEFMQPSVSEVEQEKQSEKLSFSSERSKEEYFSEKLEAEKSDEKAPFEKLEMKMDANSSFKKLEATKSDEKSSSEKIEGEELEGKSFSGKIEAEEERCSFKKREAEEEESSSEKIEVAGKSSDKLEVKESEEKSFSELEEKYSSEKLQLEEKSSPGKSEVEEKSSPEKLEVEEKSSPEKLEVEEKSSPEKLEVEEKSSPEKLEVEEKSSPEKLLKELGEESFFDKLGTGKSE